MWNWEGHAGRRKMVGHCLKGAQTAAPCGPKVAHGRWSCGSCGAGRGKERTSDCTCSVMDSAGRCRLWGDRQQSELASHSWHGKAGKDLHAHAVRGMRHKPRTAAAQNRPATSCNKPQPTPPPPLAHHPTVRPTTLLQHCSPPNITGLYSATGRNHEVRHMRCGPLEGCPQLHLLPLERPGLSQVAPATRAR